MPMTHIVNMHEAKSTLSSLVAKAREGDDVIIARAGKPVAKLVAYDEVSHPKRFGALKGVIPDISIEEWEETDRAIAHLWKT
jgi:prevent-host-death family protein